MLTSPPLRARRSGGFSLIELMTVIALVCLLLLAAMPSFITWTRNVKVHAAAVELQNALRAAQAEAVRRSRQVIFVRTTGSTASAAGLIPADAGARWAIVTLPLLDDERAEVVEAGELIDTSAAQGFTVTGGPAALCFNSAGRLTARGDLPLVSGECAAPNGPISFTLDMSGADRPLKVTVAPGGQVRLCDPSRAGKPEGCSAS